MSIESPFDVERSLRAARRILIPIAVVIAIVGIASATLTRVDAAHVGIRVKLAGSDRGVQDIPVVTGWVFYNPLTEQVFQFPTSVQNVVWTASAHEGKAVDESITFSSKEGVNMNADIGLSFHIDGPMAPHLYLRFRQVDLLILADGYVRNAVREAFNDVASKMAVQDIYGASKGKVVMDVTQKLKDVLGKDGFIIDQITINGALRLPESVAQSINRAMEATQNAIQAENRVRQVKAEADQAVAQAHGGAEAARERAQGEADAVLIRAHADAKANEIIRLSATGVVIQYRAIEKWDGRLPLMQDTGQLPLLTFEASKLVGSEADREKRLRELLGEGTPKGAASPGAAPTAGAEPPAPPPAPPGSATPARPK